METFQSASFDQLVPGRHYDVLLICDMCGACLNDSCEPQEGAYLRREWTNLNMSMPLFVKPCLAGCPSTYSDINFSTELVMILTSTTEGEDKSS